MIHARWFNYLLALCCSRRELAQALASWLESDPFCSSESSPDQMRTCIHLRPLWGRILASRINPTGTGLSTCHPSHVVHRCLAYTETFKHAIAVKRVSNHGSLSQSMCIAMQCHFDESADGDGCRALPLSIEASATSEACCAHQRDLAGHVQLDITCERRFVQKQERKCLGCTLQLAW